MIQFLSSIKKRIRKLQTPDNKQLFETLPPINNADLGIYKSALDFVFSNNGMKNIAISGPYGSGKSSVIETYKRSCPNKKFLHISLAHFMEINGDSELEKGKISEPILEGKIINQLLHQVKSTNIPQTNFKIKRNISRAKLFRYIISFILSLVFILYLIYYKDWKSFVLHFPIGKMKDILSLSTHIYSRIFAGIAVFLLQIIIIYSLAKIQINRNIIKRLSFQGNNLELFNEETESYFDKYLNEVLYIFNNSKADVIVFEDMDRYNANQIFVKLKEINTLINNKLDKKQNRIIRFVYLLKDDIFINKDRTKFFDFIIPVVPVIDSSNSFEQFIEILKNKQIYDRFDKYFLQELSLYIDDMRILKNVFNEYIIYHDKIGKIERDNNKLLAIMVYKNLFPRDYSDLQFSRGYVNYLFSKKEEIINYELSRLTEQISVIDKKIKSIEEEHLTEIAELETLYIKLSNYQQLLINGKDYSGLPSDFEILKTMKANPGNIQFTVNGSRGVYDIQKVLASLDSNKDFSTRKDKLNEKVNSDLDNLKQKKNELQYLKSKINDTKLKDLITKDNFEKVFNVDNKDKKISFEEIKTSQYYLLIVYLIRNGYIDETYHDYMNIFYANSISLEDKNFLKSITDKKKKEYNYRLKDVKTIISRLKPSDYEHEEILNFDLLAFFAQNQNEYQEPLKNIFDQLSSAKDIAFVVEFIEEKKDIIAIGKNLADYWPEFFSLFLNDNSILENKKSEYVAMFMSKLETDDICKFNDKNMLTNYISNYPEFLSQQNVDIKSMISKLKEISVKFVRFERNEINIEFFDKIYRNELYQLNFDTITFILKTQYGITEEDNIVHKNYTVVSSKPEEPLYKHIEKYLNSYIDIAISNCQGFINDDETAAIKLINHKKIDEDKKGKYIGLLKASISNINEVNNAEYWDLLVQNNCIEENIENVLSYYFAEEKGLNQTLIEFINAHTDNIMISTEEIDSKYGENAAGTFIQDIIKCVKLSNDKYKEIISSSHWVFDEFNEGEVSDEKILILIDTGTISMTSMNLDFIRDSYPECTSPFAVRNIKKYIELIDDTNIVTKELLSILDKDISDTDKIELIKKTNEKIITKNKKYSDVVKTYILDNNFYSDDIVYLVNNFDNETVSMKDNIIKVIIKNIDLIKAGKYKLPYNIMRIVLKQENFDIPTKTELLANNSIEYDTKQIYECLKLIGDDSYNKLLENKRPKIVKNETNKKLLGILKNKNIIRKYEDDKKDTLCFRVYGRKQL